MVRGVGGCNLFSDPAPARGVAVAVTDSKAWRMQPQFRGDHGIAGCRDEVAVADSKAWGMQRVKAYGIAASRQRRRLTTVVTSRPSPCCSDRLEGLEAATAKTYRTMQRGSMKSRKQRETMLARASSPSPPPTVKSSKPKRAAVTNVWGVGPQPREVNSAVSRLVLRCFCVVS